MEAWRIIFRDGFAPSLSTKGLLALREGLLSDAPTGITFKKERGPSS